METENRVLLDGEWDMARREELDALFSRLKTDAPATIDLRTCTFVDSTVLSALVTLRARFAATPITLLRPSPQLQKILRIANFERLFEIRDHAPD